jgi:pimeloyl-ACP methyl ester carboxylesterase
MFKHVFAAAALGLALISTPALSLEPTAGATAEINGLQMYYEVHGETGEPLVLLHGAYMTIPTNWDVLIPTLSKTHQVIAVETQNHGRTSDRDTPITYEGMADDVAALLDHLGVEKAVIFGYSMGASTAIQVAVRHPQKVSRLVAASGGIAYEAYPEGFYEMIETITPEMMRNSPFDEEHVKLGKTEEDFVALVEKLRALDLDRFAWPEEEIAKIDVPTLLIFGDADVIEMEHITKMYRLLGGQSNGDMKGLPKLQLAILPGTSHINVFFNPQNVEIMKLIVPTFLAQDLPAPPQMQMPTE